MACLLTPEDNGGVSVTMVLLALVTTVRDAGAGGYLVQEKELTVDRARAVWVEQLGLGLIFGYSGFDRQCAGCQFLQRTAHARHHVFGIPQLRDKPVWLIDLCLADSQNAI